MVKQLTNRLSGIFALIMLMIMSLQVNASPVTVKLDTYAHGSVTVDKATANPGETVTITVTPDAGYYCAKENVKAEKTIDGGSAQAPGLKANPGVGSFVEIQGDAPADIRDVATYTFTMPEAPYGVQVTAEFSTCSIIFASFIQPIPDQEYTGSEITPNVIVADGDNQLTLGVDYIIEFSNNVEPGQATCTVKGISKYTGNVTVNFTIFRETYEIRWGQGSPWDSQHVIAMTKGADGKWVAVDQEMAATSEFKVVKKREAAGDPVLTWYGAPANDMYWINEQTLNNEISLYEDTPNLYFPKNGIYTFTFDPTNNKLVVTGDIIYNVTVASDIQNGSVVANPTSGKVGDQITITATPAPGYELETLTYTVEGGEPVAIENNNFTMPAADVIINATFKAIEYYYDFVEQVHCTLLDETDYHHTAPAGATITLRVVADGGYKLKQAIVNKVTGEGPEQVVEAIEHTISVENDNTYLTFVMPEGNVEVHAICAKIHSITLDDGDDANNFATIDNEYSQAIEGETVTVSTHVNEEYKVSEIYYTYMVDDVEQQGELTAGENGVYTFTMPDADVTVVVRFDYKVPRHKVKFFPVVEGGTISVTANGTPISSMDEVPEISIIEVTVTPDEGYVLDDLMVYEGLHELDDDFLGVNTISWELMEGKYRFELHFTDVTIIPTFKMEEFELEGVTFTADRQWATYYNGTKNLALPEGIQAYVVNGVINDAVDITEIDYIPAGVGVLLYCENAANQVMTTAYTGELGTYTSLLLGSDEAQAITSGYVLYNNNFIRSEEGTVAAHRCYLPVSTAQGAPAKLSIGYSGGVVTAIRDLIAEGNVAAIKYVNVNGQTSSEPFNGINIAVITLTDGSTRTAKVVK